MELRNLKGKRVYVGLSGGVDSALSARLLQKAGADVTGVFIKGWYPPGMPCTWASDRRDAMRVAARLQIPFYTLDASVEYKKGVIDYLIAAYKAGHTPNPDIMCNREVKFGAFYAFAKRSGADYVATGHYAQGGAESAGNLLRAIDPEKDQSYFLWAVSKEVLAQTIFPVGNMHKERVRELARKEKLPVATKKDSQGICFLGSISVEEFLKSEFGSIPGRAVNETGKEVGTHAGAVLYTLGERVGLVRGEAGPWFVIAKNIDTNEIVVSHEKTALQPEEAHIMFRQANWFGGAHEATHAQTRYHGPLTQGSVVGDVFVPTEPFVEIPAPGQSIVFYAGNRVIGGGIMNAN